MENETPPAPHPPRRTGVFLLTIFFLSWLPAVLGAESLELTTYYPAPYAGYNNLLTTGGMVAPGLNTLLARDHGRVGIGTPTPRTKLSVMDTIAGLTTGMEFSSFYVPGVAAGGIINAYDENGASVRSLVLQYNGGRVGVGPNLDPQASLHVVGTFKLQDGTEGLKRVLTSDASGSARWTDPGASMPNCSNRLLPENSNNKPCLAPLYRCPQAINANGASPIGATGASEYCQGQIQMSPTCQVWISFAEGWPPNVQDWPCPQVGTFQLY
ncbi:MAG: hypothetical protein WCW52_06880 [Elusimicrobiales bacterium]|jgi:hypothetical protein